METDIVVCMEVRMIRKTQVYIIVNVKCIERDAGKLVG